MGASQATPIYTILDATPNGDPPHVLSSFTSARDAYTSAFKIHLNQYSRDLSSRYDGETGQAYTLEVALAEIKSLLAIHKSSMFYNFFARCLEVNSGRAPNKNEELESLLDALWVVVLKTDQTVVSMGNALLAAFNDREQDTVLLVNRNKLYSRPDSSLL